MELLNTVLGNFTGFLFVLCRITGIFTFNPIFSRNNVPNRAKAAMSIALSVVVLVMQGGEAALPQFSGVIGFFLIVIKELFIGFVFGFFTNMIMTVIVYAGEIIDTQVGLGMAKAMDPSTGVTMPLFANLYYYLFILYFFLTEGHLSYIKLFALSYETIPIGYDFTVATLDLTYVIVNYFGTVLTLAVKFAIPIIAAELITEICVGLMMKAIPTIQVYVVNIQLKVIVGFMVLLAAARPMSEFIEGLLGILFENLYVMSGSFV